MDEDGVLVEEEPDDLGEYSRPPSSLHNSASQLPEVQLKNSNNGNQTERVPLAAGSSIIYAPTRAEVESIAAKLKVINLDLPHARCFLSDVRSTDHVPRALQSAGLAVEAYHAGLRPAHLGKVHSGFLRGDIKVGSLVELHETLSDVHLPPD